MNPLVDDAPETIDLTDQRLFERGSPEAAYARLRRQGGVYWNRCAEGGFWAVVRHREINQVYADNVNFSSLGGVRLNSDPVAVRAAAQRMLIVSDPPVHTGLRRSVGRTLTPTIVRQSSGRIRRNVERVLDEAVERRDLDFVTDVARKIPEAIICALLGVPEADTTWVADLTTQAFEAPDPEDRGEANAQIFLYFDELVARRRAEPQDDVVTRLIAEGMDLEHIVLNCSGLLSGGNETTRHALSGAVFEFARLPEQYALLRNDEGVVPTAVEEILRWTSPALYVLRTVVRPVEVGGEPLRVGDQVALWNAAANRDEEAFEDPQRFDVTRSPNRHVGFGNGRHMCLGAKLARLEIETFLAEFRRRVAAIEVTGETAWNGSNFAGGLRRLPVRLTPA